MSTRVYLSKRAQDKTKKSKTKHDLRVGQLPEAEQILRTPANNMSRQYLWKNGGEQYKMNYWLELSLSTSWSQLN